MSRVLKGIKVFDTTLQKIKFLMKIDPTIAHSISYISKDLNVDNRSIKRVIEYLIKEGWVETIKTPTKTFYRWKTKR